MALAVGAGAASAADLDFRGGIGERTYHPTTARSIPADGYKLGVGRLAVDLRELDWRREKVVRLKVDLGAGQARITPRPATSAAGGWQRREVAVELRRVPYARAAQFLADAAATPPAWRLREIEIKPSAEAGQGAMTLVLVALEKKQP